MLKNFAAVCDRLLLSLARVRTGFAIGYLMSGLVILLLAFQLGLHDVTFTGNTIAGEVGGLNENLSKQVGYIWAPNWALASLLILPFAIYNLLAVRASAERILPNLLRHGMLVREDGSPVDASALELEWRKTSGAWSVAAVACILGSGLFIFVADFLPVVGSWLSSESFRETQISGVTIGHPDYEFDWSIAALYPEETIQWKLNYAFSLGAYLLVPIFGAGLIFSMFIWIASISTFFSNGRLRDSGYVIIPDLDSKDLRRGFEIFEDLFDSLIQAGLLTAAMALCMHYQNVFLRSPTHSNIIQMLFADAAVVAEAALKGDFSPLASYFVSFDKIVLVEAGSISLQTYATATVNLLIFVIVIGLMWRWLRKLAIGGLNYTRRNIPVNSDQKRRLQNMKVWPVGWMSETLLALVISLTLAAMYYVGLLPLIIFVLLIYGGKGLVLAFFGKAVGNFQKKNEFDWLDDDEDGGDKR